LNYLPYFLFTAFILYIFFGAYVYRLNPNGRANRLFLLICACYAVWAFSYTNIHSVEIKEDVWFWHRFSLPAKIFFSMLIVHFFLSFTGSARRLKYPAYLIYAPGFLFLSWSLFTGQLGVVDFSRQNGIWLEEYGFGNPVDALYYLWHALLMFLSLALIIEWRRRAVSRQEKMQSAAMLITGIPALGLTLLSNIAYLFTETVLPNFAPAAGVIWIAGIWYAVSKYEFLKINPEIAFDSILKSIVEGLILTNERGTVQWVNRSALAITGYQRSELINSEIEKLFKNGREPREFFSSGSLITQHDSIFLSKDGGEIPVLLSIAEVVKADRTAGYVLSFQDITDRKRAEDKIRYIGFHDKLTKLYNRSFAEEEMKRLDAPRQLPLSVIICDVDGLKSVNDFYGHIAGDKLIIEAAECIKSSCRQEDIIARWGGDEFIVFLPQTAPAHARLIAGRISEACAKAGGLPFKVSLSTGTAAKENAEEDINDVLKKADDAMYMDKLENSGRGSVGRAKESGTILIVEDEEDFSEAMALRLTSCGYKVRTANSAADGLSLARELKPDVVIMDVMFPGEMDGYRATEILKKESGSRGIPVIIISAKTMDEDIKRGYRCGADFYLTKPLDSRDLLDRINSLSAGLS
jgi:diguanylate cyclase (GGDEF)-like protein/PAS domain S-box-containing protein